MPKPIPFSQLSIPELIAAHNELAAARGARPLRHWRESRCKLVERVALLRATPIKLKAMVAPRRLSKYVSKRPPVFRNAVMKELARVTGYRTSDGLRLTKELAKHFPRESLISVGLSYDEVGKRVRAQHPGCSASPMMIRWIALQMRDQIEGYTRHKLPDTRPRG